MPVDVTRSTTLCHQSHASVCHIQLPSATSLMPVSESHSSNPKQRLSDIAPTPLVTQMHVITIRNEALDPSKVVSVIWCSSSKCREILVPVSIQGTSMTRATALFSYPVPAPFRSPTAALLRMWDSKS